MPFPIEGRKNGHGVEWGMELSGPSRSFGFDNQWRIKTTGFFCGIAATGCNGTHLI
jgi:hypothetical protein